MNDPNHASDYHDHEVEAVRRVLIELGQVLGDYLDCCVIVGGSVPWLWLEKVEPPHVGTLDVDLGLDANALKEGRYACLIETLEGKGYVRNTADLKPFQLAREVVLENAAVVNVCVDLVAPREQQFKGSRPPRVSGLRVLQIPGCQIALEENSLRSIEGTMPDGRPNTTSLRVATIPAMLVMKGYALVGRDKQKDAYDIYYAIRHSPGEPADLAQESRHLLKNDVGREGLELIRSKFGSADDFGPATVVAFMEGELEVLSELTGEQLRGRCIPSGGCVPFRIRTMTQS